VDVPESRLFAVIRTRGAAWEPSRPLEQQPEWEPHRVFMNSLVADGFVVLGGPLEGTPDVLLIVRARSADEVANRLAEDPWTASGLLRISRITPWRLRLGSLP
jgi:uncharacterized protein YciI